MKPPFAYYGGKTTLGTQIADLLPPHQHYVEPFAGSLAVLLAKRMSHMETVNDLDRDLVTFWRILRDRPDDLQRLAALTPHAREEFESSKDLDVDDELERARRVWVRLTQSRSQSMKPTGWKFGANPENRMAHEYTHRLDTFTNRIQDCARRLRTVSLECRDAIEVIEDYGRHDRVCLYVDPPYLGSTRATNYRHELLGDDQHTRLADALNDCKGSVVLSGYDSPLYTELFEGWYQTRIKAPTTIAGDNDRVEVLWSNRPLGEPDLFGGAA